MSAVKTTVKTMLESGTDIPVFYERAEKDARYPYFVFECRRISESNGVEKYVLEVNGWDQAPTSSKIEAKMDELEAAIHTLRHNDRDRVVIIYKGPKGPVDDEDKSIRRYIEKFEMQICERRQA